MQAEQQVLPQSKTGGLAARRVLGKGGTGVLSVDGQEVARKTARQS